ncbi:MAG: hypothetical protein A2046_02480 [Bacteroidetes bacterium GWA2_30_7]|nr:MAG: hypothetical protein A2046_02480 [Bacteroidetes bacterium GWA2_30_7]
MPNLILLDILMPGLNGFEVLSKLKQNPVLCNIPVILVSAVYEIEERIKGFNLGAVDYIVKPFLESDLISRVKLHLELVNIRKEIIINEQFNIQLFELHIDSIFLVENGTGKILKANIQASKLFGYTVEELLQLTIIELSAEPEKTQKVISTSHLTNDNLINIPLRWHKKKNGTIFPVEISARLFEWNNKKVYFSSIKDITERINTEKLKNIQYKISEQLNSDINNNSYIKNILQIIKDEINIDSIAIKYKNFTKNITLLESLDYDNDFSFSEIPILNSYQNCNQNNKCICDYLINKSNSKLFTEFGSFYTNDLEVFLNSNIINEEQIVYKNECYNAGYKSIALVPIFNNKNEKVGILQLNHLTENFFNSEILIMLEAISKSLSLSMLKKEFIEQIKESEKKYKDLVENINDIFITITSDFKINYISNSIEKLFGYNYKELIDKSLSEIIYNEDIEIINSNFNDLLKNKINPCEFRIINKSGQPFWCRFSGNQIFTSSDVPKISGIISIIEERKQKEIEINYLNNELEQIIYVTSHDLRSPLVNIQGFSQEIKKILITHQQQVNIETDIEKLKNHFNKIHNTINDFYNYIFPSITKINVLIDGLLSLSRIGRVDVKFEKIDMNTFFKNILIVMEYKIKQNNIKIILNNISDCYSDERLLNQLFSNLIDNAIKYRANNRESFIKIYSEESDKTVTYFIEDNGIGINKSDLDKIFSLYFKSIKLSSGEGVGLAIVKKIIHKLGSSINIDSEPDVGSCFKVTIKKIACVKINRSTASNEELKN